MTEPGEQQRHKLYFLSTLLSQKVPEKADAVLRCMIAGQPKPEVTWYKNGQAIDKSGKVSSYEFFENQYIHLLQLSCCTQSDAAVYQVSAKSCLGMICCSAAIEVEHLSRDPLGSPDPRDGSATGGKRKTETPEEEGASEAHEKGHPYKAEESICPVAPMPAHSSPSKLSPSHPSQIWAGHDLSASSSENAQDVRATRWSAEACHPNSTQAIVCNSNSAPEKQYIHHGRTAHATVSGLLGGLGDDEEVFTSDHHNTKVPKYISFSLPLSEANVCAPPGDSASATVQPSPQVSSDSDSDYELCPEITLTCTEEFSDDDLEYLECSDVMTDYSNTLWQRRLQGTDCVFLLESDDEEMEFSECGLGGWEPFLREMGRGPQVSDDTGPKDAAAGFWGHQSQLPEAGVRSSGACRHCPSPLHTVMTLTLGPHQDGTATVAEPEPGRCPLPAASEAAENDYLGIQGETRDNHEAEEASARGSPLAMGEAAPEGEAKPWSAGLDKPEVKRAPESLAGERSEEKHPSSRRGAPRPGRMRRPGVRGNAKRLLRRDSAPEGIPRPPPQDPPEQPLTQSNQRETPHAKARAPGWSSPLHAEQCAFPTPAEQDSKTPGPPADSLSKEGATSFEGGRMLPSNLFEMSQAPEQSDDRQMHIWETSGECRSPSQKSPFSMPAGKTSSSVGTTTDFFSNLKETHKESASSAHLGLESCAQGPQREDRQGREGRMPGGPWAEAVDEQRAPESSDEKAFPALPLACLPRDISAQCMEPAEPSPALENVHSGSRDREAACVVECFEASDQGTCYDTMEPPVGTPVDKYLLQEICPMDFELTEGHRKVPDLCSSDKTLAVLPHTRGPEAPPSTGEGSKHGNSAESSFLTRTFTQAVSLEASEGAVGGHLAEGEKSVPILSSSVQDGREWPSPFNSGGLLETQPLSFEDSSLGPLSEGDDERPISSAPDAPDSPASHSQFPQELSTALTADSEYLPVTRDVEDTSLSVTSNVAPSKYHAVSISESDFVHSAGERPHEAPSELHFQFPHNVLIGSTNESSRKLRRLVPRVAGGPGPILRRLRGEEGVYSNSLLQTGNDSRGKNRAEHQADSGSLQEDFREKGSETERRLPPQSQHFCQASLSAKDFQESWSPAADMPGEISEGGGLSSGAPVEEDAAESLMGQEAHAGLGAWEVGHKVKVIILEASDCEIWPPRQMTESEGKEGPEASAMSPGRDWALSDTPKADATVPSGVASWAHGPPADTATATAFDSARGSWAGDAPGTDAHWDNLPSQCSDLPTLLGSSVDPVEDVLDPRPGASATGGKAGMSTASHVREEHQDKVDHPAFLKQLLHFPGVLESSVDPVNDKDGRTRPRGESPLPGLGEASLGPTEAGPAILQAPHRQDSAGASPDETSTSQGQGDREQGETRQGQHGGAKAEVQPDVWQVPYPAEGGQGIPGAFGMSQMQGGSDRSPGEAERPFATSALPGPHAVMTHPLAKAATHTCTGEPEPGSPQSVLSPLKQRGAIENTCGDCVPTSSDQTHWPWLSSPEGNITHCLRSHSIEEPKMVLTGETEALSSSSSPTLAPVFISRERESETAPKLHQDLCQKGSILGNPKRTREKPSHVPTQTGKLLGAPWAGNGAEVVRRKQESSGSGHLAEGIKKKVLSKVAALRLRLEEKENVQKNSGLLTKIPKLEKSLSCTEERREPKKAPCMREGKAPVLLKKIQAEMSPDHSGNVKLSCQFAEIHEDSTIWWTKDSKSIAQVQRSAGDNSSVSLAIMQAGQKDQGLYYCDIANSYGKVTAEFNLTAEVLKGLSRHMDSKGCEEIEFSQLILREDFLNDSYFGGRLRGQIATEELHFGEGVHRRAFRSTVMRGLLPVFQPGHACVLKVHNAIAHGTRDNDELVQKNYKLAAQECYVQNTARHYAKIYAAEAQPLEGFGEVPEIIPIFLIHRPENNIPYATVEEELIGEFVKYSIRDGKEINFLRRDSEAGQKCCTFQHWVYQKTGGCLLVTDMQGVGMKLTDVGIATLAKGYKGFKGNCSMSFIDQFKALHQCNKYCKMLGLKSLQNNSQKPKKPILGKARVQTNSPPVKTPDLGTPAERKAQNP